MTQNTMEVKAPKANPAGTFNMRMGNTTYIIGVYFSKTSKDTLEGKMKRLMRDEVKQAASKLEIIRDISLFCLDITLPKGDIVVTCGQLLLKNNYSLKVFNTINFRKSMHYNPFAYIHSEKDILKLVTTLIANTKGDGKAGDEFWTKAETLLYCALIGYIHRWACQILVSNFEIQSDCSEVSSLWKFVFASKFFERECL